MNIHNLATEPLTDSCSDKYLLSVELHRAHIETLVPKIIPVDPMLNIKCKGDYLALLSELGIEKRYHLVAMEHNGFIHPSDYRDDVVSVSVPNTEELNTILTLSNLV